MSISKTNEEKFHLIQWIIPEAISSFITFILFFSCHLKGLLQTYLCKCFVNSKVPCKSCLLHHSSGCHLNLPDPRTEVAYESQELCMI